MSIEMLAVVGIGSVGAVAVPADGNGETVVAGLVHVRDDYASRLTTLRPRLTPITTFGLEDPNE